jgi:transposase
MQAQYECLTDDQWEVIKHFLNYQRKRILNLRDVFDAILWITRTGAQWRNLESRFPPWPAVYYYFYKWSNNGILERINMALNTLERKQLNKCPSPSLGIVDSQSVKLAPMIYEYRGIDGNKWVNGRKRQLLVDVLGRIWQTSVHAANVHDSLGGVALLENIKEQIPSLENIMGDKSYRGTFCEAVEKLEIKFEVPHRDIGNKAFVVEAKRWVVERTFAWLNFFRRIVIDYEHTPRSAQSFLLLANISMVIWQLEFEST